MGTVIDRIEALSVELFAAIPSQTSASDKRSATLFDESMVRADPFLRRCRSRSRRATD